MIAADQHLSTRDYYQVLGVARRAASHDITLAWRQRARAEHPDLCPHGSGATATDQFRFLAEAHRVLGNPGRRAAYDKALGTASVTCVRPVWVRPAQPPLRTDPVCIDGWTQRPAGATASRPG